jgi:ribosomal protein S16
MKGAIKQENMERINVYVPRSQKQALIKLTKLSSESLSHWLRHGINLVLKENEDVISNTSRGSVKKRPN